MRYYLLADLIGHAWQWSHQVVAEGVDPVLGAVARKEVPHDVESSPERKVPDDDVVGGRPAVEVVA